MLRVSMQRCIGEERKIVVLLKSKFLPRVLACRRPVLDSVGSCILLRASGLRE